MTYNIPYSFIPGTKARAQEVNANFSYVLDSISNINDAKLNTSFSNITSEGIDVIKNCTAFRNIGEVIYSVVPLNDAGLHLLDGTLLSGNGSYSEFVEYIASLYEDDSSASYFCTENEWQSALSTHGVCGKFVYDSVNNTLRLPKYSNKLYTSLDNKISVVGNGIALGFTDGTSTYTGLRYSTPGGQQALQPVTSAYGVNVGTIISSGNYATYNAAVGITTKASKSGIVANLSDVSTALEGYYYIVISTSTQTDIQVDIDDIASDLNFKADKDLTNTTPSNSFAVTLNSAGIRTITETYINGTSWYRLYSDGWCEQGSCANPSSSSTVSSVTLLKNFKDSNYSVLLTCVNGGWTCRINNKATSYFNTDTSGRWCWYACGYTR